MRISLTYGRLRAEMKDFSLWMSYHGTAGMSSESVNGGSSTAKAVPCPGSREETCSVHHLEGRENSSSPTDFGWGVSLRQNKNKTVARVRRAVCLCSKRNNCGTGLVDKEKKKVRWVDKGMTYLDRHAPPPVDPTHKTTATYMAK